MRRQSRRCRSTSRSWSPRCPTPTPADEKDLKALFDKYRERLPERASPEPGFREPHQVVVQYFRADMKSFLDPREVTDEEVQKFYDEHKDTDRRLQRQVERDIIKVEPNPKAETPKI